MKKIATFFLFLSSCLILIFVSFWIINQYRLNNQINQIISSIQNKNLTLFSQNIDPKLISKDLVDGYRIAEQVKQSAKERDVDEPIKTILSLKNTLVDTVYSKFEDDIQILIIQFLLNKSQNIDSLVFDTDEIVLFLQKIDWNSLKVEYNTNTFNLESFIKISFYNQLINDNLSIEILLKKDKYWHGWNIVGLKDFYKTMIDYYDKKEKAIMNYNMKTNKEMGEIVQLTAYETKTFTYFERFGNSTKHKVTIKNISEKYVYSIKVRIWVYTENGDLVEKIVEDRRGIQPNDNLIMHIQDFDPNFNYEMNNNHNYPKMEIIEVNLGKYLLKYINDFEPINN